MGPERAASLAAIPESFEALVRRVHAAAAVAERRTNTSGGDVVIGFAAEDAAYDLAGSHAAAALGSLAFAGVLDRDAALGVLGERAGLLRGIIACAASGNDDDDGPTGVSDRRRLVPGVCPASIRRRRRRHPPPTGVNARAPPGASRPRIVLPLVAARVIVSHPGDACAALARVLLNRRRRIARGGGGGGGGARVSEERRVRRRVPRDDGRRPGLVSGLRSALVGEGRTTYDGATRAKKKGGTYAAAALARLAGDGSGRGEGKAAAAVLGAAPGVVNALARALDNAEAGGDAGGAATCAEGSCGGAASVRGGRGERGAGAARERVDDAGVNRGGASGRLPSRVAGTAWESSLVFLAVTFGSGQLFTRGQIIKGQENEVS